MLMYINCIILFIMKIKSRNYLMCKNNILHNIKIYNYVILIYVEWFGKLS